MYIVVRFDSDRTHVVIGSSTDLETAQANMLEDFKSWFWQKTGNEPGKTFDELFSEGKGDEWDIDEESAWINQVNSCDFDWKIIDSTDETMVFDSPMTKDEILVSMDENGYVSGIISVDLSDMIDNDLEGFLDLISERLVGSDLLTDIDYTPVNVMGCSILLEVSGCVDVILESGDEEDGKFSELCEKHEEAKPVSFDKFEEGMVLRDDRLAISWRVIKKTEKGGILQTVSGGENGTKLDATPDSCRMNFYLTQMPSAKEVSHE